MTPQEIVSFRQACVPKGHEWPDQYAAAGRPFTDEVTLARTPGPLASPHASISPFAHFRLSQLYSLSQVTRRADTRIGLHVSFTRILAGWPLGVSCRLC